MFSLLRGCALIFAVSCAVPQVMAEDTVRIDVTATIAEHCGISRDASSVDSIVPDLDKAQLLRFPFKIDCNTPFAIGVRFRGQSLTRDSRADSRLSFGRQSWGSGLECRMKNGH